MELLVQGKAVSEGDLLSQLGILQTKFRRFSAAEITELVTDNNPWMIGNILPVNADKEVVVPYGVETPKCRLTTRGFQNLVNSFGVSTSFEGIGDGSRSVIAWAMALQCRFTTFHLDLDLNVFGNLPVGSELHPEILAWVINHADKALKVRGNRQRLSLFFRVTPALAATLQSLEKRKNKAAYKMADAVNGKIEIGYGIVNNTFYGTHPESGHYQQIAPEGDEIGTIDVEDYKDLVALLEKHSYSSTGDGDYRNESGKVELEDVPGVIQPLRDAMRFREKMLKSQGISDTSITISIVEYLNTSNLKVLNGELINTGSEYAKPSTNPPIGSGNRRSTYQSVGNDINQIVDLLKAVGISYRQSDIDQILAKLWELTDHGVGDEASIEEFFEKDEENDGGALPDEDGKFDFHTATYGKDDRFDQYEAKAALAGFPISLYGPDYLVSLVKRLSKVVMEDVIAKLPKKKKKTGKGEVNIAASSTVRAQFNAVLAKVEAVTVHTRHNVNGENEYVENVPPAIEVDAVVVPTSKSTSKPELDPVMAALTGGATIAVESTEVTDNDSSEDSGSDSSEDEGDTPIASIPANTEEDEDDEDDDLFSIADDLQAQLDKKLGNEEEKKFQIDNDDFDAEVKDRIDTAEELKKRAYADDYSLIPPLLRPLAEANSDDIQGFSYAFATTMFAAQQPLFGNATVLNSNNPDNKGEVELFATSVNPFSLSLGASSTGKSRVIDPFKDLIIVSKYLAMVSPEDIADFRREFCDKSDRFLEVDEGIGAAAVSGETEETVITINDEDEADALEGTKEEGNRVVITAKATAGHEPDDENSADLEEFTMDATLRLRRIRHAFAVQSSKPTDYINSSQYMYVDEATEAGVRNNFLDQQLAYSVKLITNNARPTYPRPLGIVTDEIGGLFEKVYDSRNHAFSPQYVCDRKAASGISASTSTQRSGLIKKAGFAISGAMTTTNFLQYLRTEVENSTLGFLPRFNLTMLKGRTRTKRKAGVGRPAVNKSRKVLSMYLAIYGIIINAVSQNPEWYETDAQNPPIQVPIQKHNNIFNIDIYGNEKAQLVMNEFENEVVSWIDDVKGTFDDSSYHEFINSFAGKSYQEVAIYAASLCISNQYWTIVDSVLDEMGLTTPQLLSIAYDHNDSISTRFVTKVRNALIDRTKLNKIRWRREVTVEEMQGACNIYRHSMSVMELILSQAKNSVVENTALRARMRVTQNQIRSAGDRTFDLENQVKAVFQQLIKLNATSDSFTVASNIVNRSRVVQRMADDNPESLEKVFTLLKRSNIVRKVGTTKTGNEKLKFKLGMTADELLEFRRFVLESMFQIGNET